MRLSEKQFYERLAKRSIEATLGVSVDHHDTTEEGIPDLTCRDDNGLIAVEVKQILYPESLRTTRALAYADGYVTDDRLNHVWLVYLRGLDGGTKKNEVTPALPTVLSELEAIGWSTQRRLEDLLPSHSTLYMQCHDLASGMWHASSRRERVQEGITSSRTSRPMSPLPGTDCHRSFVRRK